MRRAARRDANEDEIVEALKAAGAKVRRLDFIDLLVGFRRRNYLLEVKNPKRKGKDMAHRMKQAQWRAEWPGQAAEVTTVEEALAVLGMGVANAQTED
jgi:hypothetical protein